MKVQTKILSKNTYLTILSVIMVLVTMIGTSYGFLMKTNEAETSYTTGILQVELVTTGDGYGETINLLNTVPMTNEEAQDIIPYKFIIKNTGNLNYQFDLKLVLDEEKMTEDGCADNTLSFSNVKVQVNDETPVLLSDLTDSILISNSVLNAGKSMEVSIRIWLDENTTNEAIGKHFHAILATDGYAIETESSSTVVLANHITSLYTNATKTSVENGAEGSTVTYEYAKDISMMTDVGGNIRYYGADPDNYIYFNCETYPDTNCEKWRIIGIFDKKIKIMRNESIGTYSWDTSASGVNSGYGINQWGESTYTDGSEYTGADLMKLLNPGYESNQDLDSDGNTITVNNSLYYTGGSGSCYNGSKNAYTSCDFTSAGLKNEETQNMIAETLYYLGSGSGSLMIYADQMYEKEREELNYGSSSDSVNRTTTWTGKIALPYPSDYGYAVDLEICTVQLVGYSSTTCKSNNWMKSILSSNSWLITPHSGDVNLMWVIGSSGDVNNYDYSASSAFGVAPTLYLNSDVVIDSSVGTGDVDDPYRIIIE